VRLSITAIFVTVLILHTEFDSPPSSLFVEVPVAMAEFPVPVSVPTVPIAIAFSAHSPVATHSAIVAVVALLTRVAVTAINALLCSPVASYLDIPGGIPVLLARLVRLLRALLRLHRTRSGQAGRVTLLFRK
jgi:hypothetical protein